MKLALIVVILLFPLGKVWAFETGNEFLRECGSSLEPSTVPEHGQAILCLGYIRGFANGIELTQALFARFAPNKVICFPAKWETGQILRIALKSMQDNPSELHQSVSTLIFSSLMDAFPCRDQ